LARGPDVTQVLLLALVDLPEHPLEEYFGEPEHGGERRTELVRHAGEELRRVATGHGELGALVLDLAEQLGVDDGQRRLAGEGLQQLGPLLREARRGAPAA